MMFHPNSNYSLHEVDLDLDLNPEWRVPKFVVDMRRLSSARRS